MPAYAGFDSLAHYLDERCRRERLNHSQLSEALGFRRNYIHCIYHGLFSPSRTRADRIAAFFRDDPHIVRVLAGLESPPPPMSSGVLREILDVASALPLTKQREALRYLHYLASQKER